MPAAWKLNQFPGVMRAIPKPEWAHGIQIACRQGGSPDKSYPLRLARKSTCFCIRNSVAYRFLTAEEYAAEKAQMDSERWG